MSDMEAMYRAKCAAYDELLQRLLEQMNVNSDLLRDFHIEQRERNAADASVRHLDDACRTLIEAVRASR